MNVTLHHGDLPADLDFGDAVAVDTETAGLNPQRDRLCLVQLSAGDGTAHLVRFERGVFEAPNLCRLLSSPGVLKLFHFARFDLAALAHYLHAATAPVYCTKIASRLARTYSDRHGLSEICRELLGVELSKRQQSSDWGREELTAAQLKYAAADVIHLHALRARLDAMLEREGRADLLRGCCDFLAMRAHLDLLGWKDVDIFAH